MKFDNIEKEKESFSVKKNLNKKTISDLYSLEQFPSFRFGAVGVFITSKRNVPFKLLSSIINDGEHPVSWTVKVYFSKNVWNVQIGVHPNASSSISLYSVLEKFQSQYEGIEITGHNNVASIIGIDTTENAEKITRNLVHVFKDVKLEISDFEIIEAFTLPESNSFRIPHDYTPSVDDTSVTKFKAAIKALHSYSLEEDESSILSKIENRLLHEKYISEKGKKYLLYLMKKYLSDHERISIAMKSLYSK
jgi:hypothetical protein